MRRAHHILFVVVLNWLLSSSLHAQETIPWTADRPLTKTDFRGPPPRRTRFAAATVSRLRYYVHEVSPDSFIAIVTSDFVPNKSWKKHAMGAYGLKHEQGHFDITELHARVLRERFAAYLARHTLNLSGAYKLKKMYRHTHRQMRRMQRQYDRQTRHSIIRTQQKLWNNRIAEELRLLNRWRQ